MSRKWVVVLYKHTENPAIEDSLYVRRLDEWVAKYEHLQHKWKIVAECDTNEEACDWVRKYEKLLKE